MKSQITIQQIKKFPKVLLHDHLDGGLRAQTIIDIAQEINYKDLPTFDAEELSKWFRQACDSGSLVRYLSTFTHTVSVMQREKDLIRVAKECVLDLARDGVVYAEIRGAPELFTQNGLSMENVVEATLEGYRLGMEAARSEGHFIRVEALLCGMRQNERSKEVAELVVKYRDQGVVGFDIAGPEDGFPPSRQQDSFLYLRKENVPYTIHAGEASGIQSIWGAVQLCGANRLGHGVYITDDIDFKEQEPKLGRLASYVRDRQIPLEVCPTSNIQTGVSKDYSSHSIGSLHSLGFCVTLNTDNRLMSQTSMSFEMDECVKAFSWELKDLEKITVNAMNNAFISYPERIKIIDTIIKPGFSNIQKLK